MGIEIDGLDSLITKLKRLGGNVNGCMYKGIGKSVTVIEGDAKDLCPVDTGQLRGSIHSDVKTVSTGIKGTVGTSAEYAAYQEYGTGQRGAESPSPPKGPGASYREDWTGIPAQPYLYPSLIQNKETVKKICAKELKEEIKRLAGGA